MITAGTLSSHRVSKRNNTPYHLIRSAGSVSLIDAGLRPQAKEHGFGMVGTFNTSTSTGSVGYYARTITDAGMIAFCFAQSPEVRGRDYRYRACLLYTSDAADE